VSKGQATAPIGKPRLVADLTWPVLPTAAAATPASAAASAGAGR